MLAYLLFNHYISADLLDKSANRNLFGRAVFILTLFQFYRIFTAIFYILQGEVPDLNSRTLTVANLSRFFEHSLDKFYKEVNETLEKHQFYDMVFLFQLIS